MVTASEMGKKGGQAKSESKAAAARKNASRPRGKWVTAIAYELAGVNPAFAFGLVVVAGKAPNSAEKQHDWVCQQVLKHGLGIDESCGFEFLELVVISRIV
jgi:hypothetical protein